MKGRKSSTVTIRLNDSVYTTIKEMAEKRGISINAFIKEKVEEYAEKVVHSPQKQNDAPVKLEGRLRSLGLKMEGNKIVGVNKSRCH